MRKLIDDLKSALPTIFQSEEYQTRRGAINDAFEKRQAEAFAERLLTEVPGGADSRIERIERDGKAQTVLVKPEYNAKAKRALVGFRYGSNPVEVGPGAYTGGGAFVNVLSVLSWFSLPATGAYSAAKAGVIALTKARYIIETEEWKVQELPENASNASQWQRRTCMPRPLTEPRKGVSPCSGRSVTPSS